MDIIQHLVFGLFVFLSPLILFMVSFSTKTLEISKLLIPNFYLPTGPLPEFQTCVFSYLIFVTLCLSHRFLKVNLFTMELLVFAPLLSPPSWLSLDCLILVYEMPSFLWLNLLKSCESSLSLLCHTESFKSLSLFLQNVFRVQSLLTSFLFPFWFKPLCFLTRLAAASSLTSLLPPLCSSLKSLFKYHLLRQHLSRYSIYNCNVICTCSPEKRSLP